MKELLSTKGIEVGEDGKLLLHGNSEPYEGWNFLPNGRIKFMGDEKFNIEAYTLSTYKFIEEYC